MCLFDASHEREAVANGKNYFFEAGVGRDPVVKVDYGFCLGVGVGMAVDDFHVPQGVVGKDECTDGHFRQNGIEVVGVLAFVCVDEDEVPRTGEVLEHLERVADVEVYARGVGRGIEQASERGFFFGVNLDCIEVRVAGHAFGEREGRISGESAQLEDSARSNHCGEHFEQTALVMARAHARVQAVQVSVPVKCVELFGLGVDVFEDVFVQEVVGGWHPSR